MDNGHIHPKAAGTPTDATTSNGPFVGVQVVLGNYPLIIKDVDFSDNGTWLHSTPIHYTPAGADAMIAVIGQIGANNTPTAYWSDTDAASYTLGDRVFGDLRIDGNVNLKSTAPIFTTTAGRHIRFKPGTSGSPGRVIVDTLNASDMPGIELHVNGVAKCYIFMDSANVLQVQTGGKSWYLNGNDGNLYLPGGVLATKLGSAGATNATTPGSVVKKLPIYDDAGTLLGYLPVYSAIT